MMLADMHAHTKYSFDGHFTTEEMIVAAIQKELPAIAFTEHYDFNQFGKCPYYDSRRERRLNELPILKEKYKDNIKVLYGLEIGQAYAFPEIAKKLTANEPFDVVIGGVHEAPFGRDIYETNYTSRQVCEDVIQAYFTDLSRLADLDFYNILAHIDFPLRVMGKYYENANLDQYRQLVEPILKKIACKNIALEVNTQGVRNWQKRICPQQWVLEYFRTCGGEMVTIGSDAHFAEHIGGGMEQAIELILSAGFKYVTSFENRKPIFHKI